MVLKCSMTTHSLGGPGPLPTQKIDYSEWSLGRDSLFIDVKIAARCHVPKPKGKGGGG